MERIEMDRRHAEALARLAREALPCEACALLVGERRADAVVVCEVREVPNADAEPARRFTIAPADFLAAERAARGRGLEIVGFFHSHPRGNAEPSAFDLERAWPYYAHVIACAGDVRAWRLADGGSCFEAMAIRFRTEPRFPESGR